ncbi:MAG: AtuA-related protein [Pseudomonadota bacterium]
MTGPLLAVPLHLLAHSRAGDKGDRLNLSLIAYRREIWPWLVTEVTEARVLERFRDRGATRVRRYALPNLQALNFVVDDVLQGGVNTGLGLDTHGKTLSFWLLAMEIRVDADLILPQDL